METKEKCSPASHSLKGLKGSPSPWLTRFIPLLESGGEVLDLACGCGRNVGYMTSWGLKVTGADYDGRCEPYVVSSPGARFLKVDLENGTWPFADESFDAVLVNFYLYRPILPLIPKVLRPGGYLLYETFMMPCDGFSGNRAKSMDFILKPLELVDILRKDLDILAYEQTLIEKGDCFQRILARKPVDGSPSPVILPSS